MKFINLNFFSMLDVLIGLLMLETVSPVPLWIANIHAFFMIFKGSITMFKPMPLEALPPLLIVGGAADLMSAAILVTGTPPVFANFKLLIAGFLGIKGIITLLSWM